MWRAKKYVIRSSKSILSSHLLASWFLSRLIFDLEDGSVIFPRYIGSYTDYTALYPRRLQLPLWEPQILHRLILECVSIYNITVYQFIPLVVKMDIQITVLVHTDIVFCKRHRCSHLFNLQTSGWIYMDAELALGKAFTRPSLGSDVIPALELCNTVNIHVLNGARIGSGCVCLLSYKQMNIGWICYILKRTRKRSFMSWKRRTAEKQHSQLTATTMSDYSNAKLCLLSPIKHMVE
jgi:hypothetical protein